MAWLLILGGAMLLLGLVLLSGKQAPKAYVRRRRDSGGPGVWIDDVGPAGGLPLDRFGHPADAAGLISGDDTNFDTDLDPGGGSGGGGGASGSWDDGGDGGSDGGGGGD
ncbi:MAG: hypothetical protein ACOYO0_11755 [Sandarakinorhabdus sp.]